MGLKEKRYQVLIKRVSNDKTGHTFSQDDIFAASEFPQTTIAAWLKADIIKEVE